MHKRRISSGNIPFLVGRFSYSYLPRVESVANHGN